MILLYNNISNRCEVQLLWYKTKLQIFSTEALCHSYTKIFLPVHHHQSPPLPALAFVSNAPYPNHILLIIPPKNHHCHCHRFLQTRRLDASLTSGRRCSPEVCPFASVGSSWERLWSGNGAVLSNLFADAHDSDFNYHSPGVIIVKGSWRYHYL